MQERRGAHDLAREQRAAAVRAVRALLPEGPAAGFGTAEGPSAPGLLAHFAPNAPEREWFRRREDGSWFAPITSVGRWMAGRAGWRLHLGATGGCRAAVDVGRDARRVQVSVLRADDGWRVSIHGVRPVVVFDVQATMEGRVPVTLDATPDGQVRVLVEGSESRAVPLDPETAFPPPHVLAFSGPDDGRGCALVWWEIRPRA